MITTEALRGQIQQLARRKKQLSRAGSPNRRPAMIVNAACSICLMLPAAPCHTSEQLAMAEKAEFVEQDQDRQRALRFFHTHTGERLDVVYFRSGEYSEPALDRISHFLRDFRTGDVTMIDRTTLDIVYELTRKLDYQGDIHIVSAYRSEKTNDMLRKKGRGVAKKSQHLVGKAIDFRLPGVDTAKLRDTAKALRRGGVGYYRKSDFVHVDSGRVRYW